MTRDEIIQNLTGKIDDHTYNIIESRYPVAKNCPTCDGKGYYVFHFERFDCDCKLQLLLQRHYFAANIGREYHDICLTHFDGPDTGKVVPLVKEYIDAFPDNFHYGLGLTFSGPIGTGKTFASTCVLKELIKQGRKVYFISFNELVNTWGASYHDNAAKLVLEDRLKTAEVLGLDELKTDGRNTHGFLADALEGVIRHRTSNLLPTIVTTNMTREQESNEFEKAFSLLAARNTRIETRGHDRRMREVRQENFELKERGERRPIC